jgi:hypothetical protein
MRTFQLIRDTPGTTPAAEVTGVVAEAVIFSDGQAVLHWLTYPAGTEVYPAPGGEALMREVREASGRSRFAETGRWPHGATALAASEFAVQDRAAGEFSPEGGSGESQDEGGSAAPPREPAPTYGLRELITFWLPRWPGGWTVDWLADQTRHLRSDVLAELTRMEGEGLVSQTRRGKNKVIWSLTADPVPARQGLRNRILTATRQAGPVGFTAQNLALALLVPSPLITGELEQMRKDGLVTLNRDRLRWFSA